MPEISAVKVACCVRRGANGTSEKQGSRGLPYLIIPKEQRDLAAKEGISTENKQTVAVQIMNLKTGESYTSRLSITGTHHIYLPTEIQDMLKGSEKIRIRLL